MMSSETGVDVQVVYSIPSPYQEKLFERVGVSEGINLRVSYCSERTSDRDWEVDLGSYEHEFLQGRTLVGQRQFNPGVALSIRRFRPDVLVVGGYAHPTMQMAIVTAWGLGIPVVLWCESHGRDWRNSTPDYRTRIKHGLLSALVRGCGAFLVPGGLQRQYLEAHGADAEAIFAGTHTCDVTAFRAAAADAGTAATRRGYGISEDIVLTYVGRLLEKKGLRELVAAAATVSDSRTDIGFVVAGSGPLEDNLRSECRRLGLDNIYFPGFVSRSDLPALYGASDAFVFPSHGDPWGVVVNEAMACGLPVITTSGVGAAYDLVVDGINGAVVPPKDVGALADAIERVLASDRAEMGQNSMEIIDEWTHDAAAETVVDAVSWAADCD